MKTHKVKIIMKVSIPDTLRSMRPGQSATFACTKLGAYGSACVAVCRLNKSAGFPEFEIETGTQGATYTITRNYRAR